MISFDWALKRLLRNKTNFEVLEDFLSELLRHKITIKSTGESEGNKEEEDDKFNRVNILVEADDRELVIVELQYDSVAEYYHRMLYGVSKAITDYMHTGDHSKVRGFDDVAKNTLDEWIYYLKNNRIEDHFTAQGLARAKELLLFDNLGDAEKEQYLRAIDEKLLSDSAIRTALLEGEIKGEAIGLEKGKEEGRIEEQEKTVISGRKAGYSIEVIETFTGLTPEQITEILKRNDLI
jgi:hypothetical protein